MNKNFGKIVWQDLTVNNAEQLRDFYLKVIGWESESLSMGDYDDFIMKNPVSEDAIAGICHAKGSNEGLPTQWLLYIQVEDVEKSSKSCLENGGKLLTEIRSMGNYHFCVIQDPAGAVCAICSEVIE